MLPCLEQPHLFLSDFRTVVHFSYIAAIGADAAPLPCSPPELHLHPAQPCTAEVSPDTAQPPKAPRWDWCQHTADVFAPLENTQMGRVATSTGHRVLLFGEAVARWGTRPCTVLGDKSLLIEMESALHSGQSFTRGKFPGLQGRRARGRKRGTQRHVHNSIIHRS